MKKEQQSSVGSIDFKEAKELVNNYAKTVKRDANNVYEQPISVWFPLEQLERIVSELQKERDNSALKNSKKVPNGVRFYFGRYGANPQHNPLYANKNTLVIVPTHTDEKDSTNSKDYFENGVENRGILCPPESCDGDSELLDEDNRPCGC